MSAHSSAHGDPNRVGHADEDNVGGGEDGPAPKRIVTAYGFWIFLLSDIIMFSAFFASYAVLVGNTADGPSGRELFEMPRVIAETGLLLLSSFACGLASVAAHQKSMLWTQIGLFVTGLLGFGFLVLELQEFAVMIADGAGPERSAFLSAFFTLVGCHGLHVGVGLLWLGTVMAQIWAKGFRPAIERRLLCFNLFWHALDIIWVAIFTLVYLLAV